MRFAVVLFVLAVSILLVYLIASRAEPMRGELTHEHGRYRLHHLRPACPSCDSLRAAPHDWRITVGK